MTSWTDKLSIEELEKERLSCLLRAENMSLRRPGDFSFESAVIYSLRYKADMLFKEIEQRRIEEILLGDDDEV